MRRLISVTLDYIFIGLVGVAVLMALDVLYRLGNATTTDVIFSILPLIEIIVLAIGIKAGSHHSHHQSSHSS